MKKRTIPTEDFSLNLITDPELRQWILEDAKATNRSVNEVVQEIIDKHVDKNGESSIQFGNLN